MLFLPILLLALSPGPFAPLHENLFFHFADSPSPPIHRRRPGNPLSQGPRVHIILPKCKPFAASRLFVSWFIVTTQTVIQFWLS